MDCAFTSMALLIMFITPFCSIMGRAFQCRGVFVQTNRSAVGRIFKLGGKTSSHFTRSTDYYRSTTSFASRSQFFSEGVEISKSSVKHPPDKWVSCSAYMINQKNDDQRGGLISNLLICGDGDLSYAASTVIELEKLELDLSITATVLEDESTHAKVYQNSCENYKTITESGKHRVIFGVDATCLQEVFSSEKFDRIQFNFPHWRGKCNHRYNRELLHNFFKSASDMVTPIGEIHVALCEGQGGSSANSLLEWRQSWMAAQYASECGLLLADVSPFNVRYNLSSHRGVDRPFYIGKNPELYKFIKAPVGEDANKCRLINDIPYQYQISCRHELHVVLGSNNDDSYSAHNGGKNMLSLQEVEQMIKEAVPSGIDVSVPMVDIVESDRGEKWNRMAVYSVAYSGKRMPMTRCSANMYREITEEALSSRQIYLRPDRMGRLVSKPFPRRLIPIMIDAIEIKEKKELE